MKKLFLAAGCLALLYTSACNPNKSTDTDHNLDTVMVPGDTVGKTKETDTLWATYLANSGNPKTAELVAKVLRERLKDRLDNTETEYRKFSFYEADLNGDGNKEIFVGLNTIPFCGSGGCSAYLLSSQGQVITYFTVVGFPFEIRKEKTNGWADLVVASDGQRLLQFNGKKYPSNPSVAPKFTGQGDMGNTRALLIGEKPVPEFSF